MAQITSVYGLDSKYTIYIYTHMIYMSVYMKEQRNLVTLLSSLSSKFFFHERNKSFYTLTMSGTGALITLAYDIACNI